MILHNQKKKMYFATKYEYLTPVNYLQINCNTLFFNFIVEIIVLG